MDRRYGGMNEDETIMWVYLLRSVKVRERVYVGLTEDIDRRVDEHNAGKSESTYRFRPWRCEVKIWFEDRENAMRFESYLKSGSGRTFSKHHF